MKKKILGTFGVIILLFSYLYFNQYRRYVSSAPTTHKEARKDYVNTMMFHLPYWYLIKAGIDFKNPILTPLKTPRDYFYKNGLKKLPLNDGERAIWFHTFELMPYNRSSKGRYGNLLKDYGEEFGNKFLDDTYKNIILLADYSVIDKENRTMHKFSVQSFFEMFDVFMSDKKKNYKKSLYTSENLKYIGKEKSLFINFSLLFDKREEFIKNKLYYYQFENYITLHRTFNGSYSSLLYDNLLLNTYILFYKIEQGLFKCEIDKKHFANIFLTKMKLRKLAKEINANNKEENGQEKVFTRLKIPNKVYDIKPNSSNPFKMYVNCTYDDIFLKEGN